MIQWRERYELKLDCAQSISILVRYFHGDKLIGDLIGRVKLLIYCGEMFMQHCVGYVAILRLPFWDRFIPILFSFQWLNWHTGLFSVIGEWLLRWWVVGFWEWWLCTDGRGEIERYGMGSCCGIWLLAREQMDIMEMQSRWEQFGNDDCLHGLIPDQYCVDRR